VCLFNLINFDNSKISAKAYNSSMYLHVLDYGMDSNFTSLHPDLNGNHPDNYISMVPYEQGFQFLTFLESLTGESTFQSFLRKYVNEFSMKSVDVDQFKQFFIQ